MKPRMTNPDPPLTVETLARAETRPGFKLPENYVAFLRENNGGRPTPNTVPTPSFPGSSATDLQRLLAIDTRMECHDLAWNYEIWLRDSPANLLPIACDSGGSRFCVAIYGDDAGTVYYWDSHREPHPVQMTCPRRPLKASAKSGERLFRHRLPWDNTPLIDSYCPGRPSSER
jgi:hypothetical protein